MPALPRELHAIPVSAVLKECWTAQALIIDATTAIFPTVITFISAMITIASPSSSSDLTAACALDTMVACRVQSFA